MGTSVLYFSGCLCLGCLLILSKFIIHVWWTPMRIRSIMRSQGINGPSYRFPYGNTNEIRNMKKVTASSQTGLTHDVFSRIQPHFYSWIKLYGRNFLYWYGTSAHLVVTEPELIKEILNDKEETYGKAELNDFVKRLLGDGIVLATGKKWIKARKLANHVFHGESLKGMIPAMIASSEAMLEKWRHHEGKEIEVFREYEVLTSEIISRTAFGSSYLEGEKIFDMLTQMAYIIRNNAYKVRIPVFAKFFKIHDDYEADRLNQGIKDIIMKMVWKREEEAKLGEVDSFGADFFGLLVKAYNDPDETRKISFEDLVDECKDFYVAGKETVASALSWIVLLLAIHADWQDKARKEVLELFGKQNPTADGIARLRIVSVIINEAMRLYTPAILIRRKVQKEVKVGKLIIPAKVEVCIPLLALHHDPQIWGKDAHLFKPERFAEGLAKATSNNLSAFLPFGSGPRSCVGINFAISEIKIALSMILQRYRFSLSLKYVHSPAPILAICPQHGIQIMLEAL